MANRVTRIIRLWPYVLLVIGLAGLGRPVALELYESWNARQTISQIESTYSDMDEANRKALRDEAERYNEALLRGMPLDQFLPYERQLAYGDTDMIAHLSIPSLSLTLPIYHDTDDNTLMIGVGHLEGSAMPVGTTGGRCVLAGHSGMPNARMFDDIHHLGVGSRFVIWTLGMPLAYEVIETETVWPYETDRLDPVPGEDLCTLVTCTPYGLNTHRLLVTGRRCEYVPDEEDVPMVEAYVNRRTIPLIVGCAATGLIFATGVIGGGMRRKARGGRHNETGNTDKHDSNGASHNGGI